MRAASVVEHCANKHILDYGDDNANRALLTVRASRRRKVSRVRQR
jgi:hypothetical protein